VAYLLGAIWGAGNETMSLGGGTAHGSAFQEGTIRLVAYSSAPTLLRARSVGSLRSKDVIAEATGNRRESTGWCHHCEAAGGADPPLVFGGSRQIGAMEATTRFENTGRNRRPWLWNGKIPCHTGRTLFVIVATGTAMT